MKKILLILMVLILLVGCENTNNGGSGDNGQNNNKINNEAMTDEEIIDYTKGLVEKSKKIFAAFFYSDVKKDHSDTLIYEVSNERDVFDVEASRVVDENFNTMENIEKFLSSIYTEAVIIDEFKPFLYLDSKNIDTALGFVEKDGKIYATKDISNDNGDFFTWKFEDAKVIYKSKTKIILQIPIISNDNSTDIGQITLSYVDNSWKLEESAFSWPGLPFAEIKRYYSGDDLLNSLESATTYAEILLKEVYDINPDDYIMVFEPFTRFMPDPTIIHYDYAEEEYLVLNLYEEKDDELELRVKAFLDVDKSAEPIVRSFDMGGVISIDYLYATYDNYDRGPLFGYALVDMKSVGNEEGYEYGFEVSMNFGATKVISSDIGTMFTEDYNKLLFMIPKFYDTKVKVYDEENKIVAFLENSIVRLQLDDKDYRVVVEHNGRTTEFNTKDINSSTELKDGFKLDYEYPMGVG